MRQNKTTTFEHNSNTSHGNNIGNIPAPVLVSVAIPAAVLIVSHEAQYINSDVTTQLTWDYCHLALDQIHSKGFWPDRVAYYYSISHLAQVSQTDSCVCWAKQECFRGNWWTEMASNNSLELNDNSMHPWRVRTEGWEESTAERCNMTLHGSLSFPTHPLTQPFPSASPLKTQDVQWPTTCFNRSAVQIVELLPTRDSGVLICMQNKLNGLAIEAWSFSFGA